MTVIHYPFCPPLSISSCSSFFFFDHFWLYGWILKNFLNVYWSCTVGIYLAIRWNLNVFCYFGFVELKGGSDDDYGCWNYTIKRKKGWTGKNSKNINISLGLLILPLNNNSVLKTYLSRKCQTVTSSEIVSEQLTQTKSHIKNSHAQPSIDFINFKKKSHPTDKHITF